MEGTSTNGSTPPKQYNCLKPRHAPEVIAEIIRLGFEEKLSPEEISERTGVPKTTVKNKIHDENRRRRYGGREDDLRGVKWSQEVRDEVCELNRSGKSRARICKITGLTKESIQYIIEDEFKKGSDARPAVVITATPPSPAINKMQAVSRANRVPASFDSLREVVKNMVLDEIADKKTLPAVLDSLEGIVSYFRGVK